VKRNNLKEASVINPYLLIFVGALSNLIAVYFMKTSEGMSRPWPAFGVVVSSLLTQWCISQSLQNGVKVALSVTAVVVTVMAGSALMGHLLFSERLAALQWCGLTMAVVGVTIATLANG